jgi:hypothetical protein
MIRILSQANDLMIRTTDSTLRVVRYCRRRHTGPAAFARRPVEALCPSRPDDRCLTHIIIIIIMMSPLSLSSSSSSSSSSRPAAFARRPVEALCPSRPDDRCLTQNIIIVIIVIIIIIIIIIITTITTTTPPPSSPPLPSARRCLAKASLRIASPSTSFSAATLAAPSALRMLR